ncbi:MAG: hypothetical protein EON58_21005, partial [Alphaproteobacteria bacterium]
MNYFRIGDPDIVGWLTVVAYLVAALLSFASYRKPTMMPSPGEKAYSSLLVRRRFWLLVTITLIALGINKQLDLQTLLTSVG